MHYDGKSTSIIFSQHQPKYNDENGLQSVVFNDQTRPDVVTTLSAPSSTDESFVPIIISAKDLEAAFFSDAPTAANRSVGDFVENAKNEKSKLVKRTRSFQEKLQKVLRNGKNRNNNESGRSLNRAGRIGGWKARVEPRLSILGTKLPPKRHVTFYRQRVFVYNLLQRPKGWLFFYHVPVILLIITSLILTVFVTVPELSSNSAIVLKVIDLIILTVLVIEFLARIWSSQCISKYQGLFGLARFLRSPFRIVEMIVLASSAIVVWSDWSGAHKKESLYWLRLLHVFQTMRVEVRFHSWRIMGQVLYSQKEHLIIVIYMAFLAFLLMSFIIYFIERNQADTGFTSIAASMWWTIVTLFTIGYGDMVPATTAGKICGAILMIFGICIFSLPSGILGTGLALKVDEKQRTRHVHKRREPAAKLIQAVWRCYAGSEESTSVATWRVRPISSSPSAASLLRQYYQKSGNSNLDLLENEQRQQPKNILTLPATENYILGEKQKNCIRFIRKLKLLVAKKQFKAACRPYDINDVLEQYSAGHSDVIGRVKGMQMQIVDVQYDITRTLKMVKNIQYQHSIHIARLEAAISMLSEKLTTSTTTTNAPSSPDDNLSQQQFSKGTTIITPSCLLANLDLNDMTSPVTSQSDQYLQIFVSERNLSNINPHIQNRASTGYKTMSTMRKQNYTNDSDEASNQSSMSLPRTKKRRQRWNSN